MTNTTPESMFVPNDVLNAYLYGDLYDDDAIFDSYQAMENIFDFNKSLRSIKYKYTRTNWQEHRDELILTNTFYSKMHMGVSAFENLVTLLRSDITVNELQSRRSTGGVDPIYPEMIVATGLRFFGGEKLKSLSDIYHYSLDSGRRVVRKFVDAVLNCEKLAINLPTTEVQLLGLAQGFSNVSGARGIFYGVIAAIDGWLCTIEKPRIVPNPGDFYSGLYKRYGLNVQAMCDANLRFIYVCVAGPGKTNDNRAFKRLDGLHEWLQQLPDSYFLIGDNAYTLQRNLLIPFDGKQREQPNNRTYNFYLSQQRIRIEMAFGLLCTKWRIFHSNLDSKFGLEFQCKIIETASRLHNYVLDEEQACFNTQNKDSDRVNLQEWGVEAMSSGPAGNKGYLRAPNEEEDIVDDVPTESSASRREAFVNHIMQADVTRPQHNCEQNIEYDNNIEIV